MASVPRWKVRAVGGFAVGVSVCIIYWLSGYVGRDVWFTSSISNAMVNAKTWLWPTAVLDGIFRDTTPQVTVAILFAINGLTYAVISLALFAFRGRPAFHIALALGVLVAVTYFNTVLMAAFSWLGLSIVLAGLLALVLIDVKPSLNSRAT